MKKFKKIKVMLSLVLCMSILFGGNVFAQEYNKEPITKNTIITEENIYDVLKYLNIDANNFIIKDEEKSFETTTVEELSNIINQFNNRNITINNDNILTPYGVLNPGEGGEGTGSIYLERDASICNDYSLTYSCWAEYEKGLWKRATNGNIAVGNSRYPVGVDYNIGRIHYNRLSVESLTKIKYSFKIDVEGWAQVLGKGFVRVGSHTVTSDGYFYTGEYALV